MSLTDCARELYFGIDLFYSASVGKMRCIISVMFAIMKLEVTTEQQSSSLKVVGTMSRVVCCGFVLGLCCSFFVFCFLFFEFETDS